MHKKFPLAPPSALGDHPGLSRPSLAGSSQEKNGQAANCRPALPGHPAVSRGAKPAEVARNSVLEVIFLPGTNPGGTEMVRYGPYI